MHRLIGGISIGVILFTVALYFFGLLGYRVNLTASMPIGVYKIQKLNRPVQRGDVLWICPPDTPLFREMKRRGYLLEGDCPGGYAHLIKPVVAIEGDVVKVSHQGVSINGSLIPNSKTFEKDRRGRPLPRVEKGRYQLKPNQVWFHSGYNVKSLDSRYFGKMFMETPIIVMNCSEKNK